MAGNREGALKAKLTNLKNNPDYYKNLGKVGGSISTTGGFASDKVGADGLTGQERAKIAGKKSRKNKAPQ